MFLVSPRLIFVGLLGVWLPALFVEAWLALDVWAQGRAAERALALKRREADRLGALDPPPTERQAASIEKELACAERDLACLEAGFADSVDPAAQTTGASGSADFRTEAARDDEDLIRDLRERARRAGVTVRQEEQFGLAAADHGAGVPAADPAGRRRREAADCLVRTLLAANPSQLLSVQGARPRGTAPRRSGARMEEDAAAGTREFFDFDPCLSVGQPGEIETVPLRLNFTGGAGVLREFLNRLSAGKQVVAIRDVLVEPLSTAGTVRHGKSSSGEPVMLVAQPAQSRFAVTAEYCELAAPTSAQGGMCSAAIAPPNEWTGPAPQQRGRGWIYELFAPPAIFRDRRSHALAAVPAEEAATEGSEAPPSDLQLLQVRKRPFRLRLAGFAGEPNDLRGIFADTKTGKTVIGRAGDRLAGHGVRLQQLSLERADPGAKGALEPMATAAVVDEETDEDIVLSTRGPSPAGAALGLFGSRKNPAWRRELKEGESVTSEGARYRVERIEMEPPLAVVARLSADGASENGHVLTPPVPPDSSRNIPAPAVSKAGAREPPTTP
jgi:hypothetical protein